MSATDANHASRHAALRWVGAPLLLTGFGLLIFAVVTWAGGGSGWNIGLSLFGTGLGLASFGANNDAALALALRASESGAALSPSLAAELEHELARDRSGLMGLIPAPTFAMIVPVLALGAQAFLLSRLLA